jgi:predicted alpha/beta hydrolase family esterase
VEKHFDKWREKEGGLRVKLLKPFKPQLDRWAKRLAKRYKTEMERNRAQQK